MAAEATYRHNHVNHDKEVDSEALNLHKWSSNSEMRGCALEGKLFERVWYLDFGYEGEAAIFC